MTYRWLGPTVLALAASIIAGCGGGSSGSSAAATPSGSPTASASVSASASPTPSPTGPNGIAALSPAAALSKVSAAAAAAQSVAITGTVAQGRQTLGLDIHAGTDAGYGTLTIGKGHVSLRLTNATLYIEGDLNGLEGLGFPKATAQKSVGKWIGAQASTTSLAALLSFSELIKSIVTPNGTVIAGRTSTVNGVSAYSLVDKTKNGGVLYVATSGEPLPVKIVNTKPHEHLSFADWGAPVTVTAPPNVVPVPTSATSSAP